jgi:hypothetical protein
MQMARGAIAFLPVVLGSHRILVVTHGGGKRVGGFECLTSTTNLHTDITCIARFVDIACVALYILVVAVVAIIAVVLIALALVDLAATAAVIGCAGTLILDILSAMRPLMIRPVTRSVICIVVPVGHEWTRGKHDLNIIHILLDGCGAQGAVWLASRSAARTGLERRHNLPMEFMLRLLSSERGAVDVLHVAHASCATGSRLPALDDGPRQPGVLGRTVIVDGRFKDRLCGRIVEKRLPDTAYPLHLRLGGRLLPRRGVWNDVLGPLHHGRVRGGDDSTVIFLVGTFGGRGLARSLAQRSVWDLSVVGFGIGRHGV